MYSPLRHLPAVFLKRQPIQLTFFVTHRCNAHCPYCFYLEDNGTRQDANGGELTLHEIERTAKSLPKLLWLAFSGGEIFLRKDLSEISNIFYKQNNPAIMLYPTNGLTPKLIAVTMEKILTDCPKSVIVVKLSIDGIGKYHDQLRNTPKSFDKTFATYNALAPLLDRYANFELGVNTVFCSENQDRMDDIIDFVSDLDYIHTHTISMVRGELKRNFYKNVDYNKYSRAIERLAENIKKKSARTYRFTGAKLKMAQDILQRRIILSTLETQHRQVPCFAGRLNLVLGETGEVYPCEMLSKSFGNVRDYDYDIMKIRQSRCAQKSLAAIKAEHCYCTHECYLMTNILLNPALYPKLGSEYLGLLAHQPPVTTDLFPGR